MAITISWSILLIIVGLVLAGVGAISKASKTRKTMLMIGLPIAGVSLIILVMGSALPESLQFINGPLTGGTGKTLKISGQEIIYSLAPNNQGSAVSVSTFQPTASYSTKDKFTTASVTGTSYYKVNGNPATTTAYTNVNKGENIIYWVSNATTYVEPMIKTTGDGVTTLANDNAYQNGSMTVNLYDLVADRTIGTSNNATLSANSQAKIQIKVVGSGKTANMPLGGVMVVEYNSTIPSVSCSGDGIVGLNNKYQVTYTTLGTTHTTKIYEVAKGFDVSTDNGNTGVIKTIRCDFSTGATAPGSNTPYYITFLPANYYLGNDGNIYLDVEQKMNSATTRTGLGGTNTRTEWE